MAAGKENKTVDHGGVYAPSRGYRLSEQLPYFEFEEDPSSSLYRVHLLKDGSLGVAWKTPVPPSYSYDDGHFQTIREFQTFIESVHASYEVQVSITSSNDLSKKMRHYLEKATTSERGQILRHSRAEKLLDAGHNGYQVSPTSYSMLRDTYMVITMRTPEQQDLLGYFAILINAITVLLGFVGSLVGVNLIEKMMGNFLKNTIKTTMGEFNEAVMTAESTLTSMFNIRRMSLEELKEHYWNAYCPSYREVGQKIAIDPLLDYGDQLFPLPIEQDGDMIKLGQDYHGLIMMAMMPDAVGPDYLGIIRRTLATQYTFFANMQQANQALEKVAITLQAALRERVATIFSREESVVVAQEASQVKLRMVNGRRVMFCMLGVVVHGYSRREVEERMLRVNSAFKKLSVIPDMERAMCLQGIIYSWPLVWRNRFTKPFARTRRVMSDDMVELIPIHGHWGGHDIPQAVYVNRDGEITFFDHTHPDFVNWHYAITGTSGSGKSFAVVDLTLQLFAAGIKKQYLMTIKDDYDRFAETMGKLIIIDLDAPKSCINPFTGEMTKHRLQQWSVALELMLMRGGSYEPQREEARLVEQIVQFAYELVPEDDCLRPSWIREAYMRFPYTSTEQRNIGFQSAEIIGSYCQDGVYGKLFDGPPSITEKDQLVVFNLQNVLSEKISDVIVNAIFTMLDNIMYLGDRGEKKHLLVDEMISMVSAQGGQQVANQLKRAFRTYRSLNCMCGIATQNEEDLTTEVGQAIIGNITKRMILKPRREMIPLLMQSLGLRSERHAENIGSLETKPGFYSEFYLMSPHGEVICRLLTDKLTYALATTTPDDVAELNRLAAENGGDRWKAALQFSQLYPHGVRAAQAAARQRAAQQGSRVA
jgi:hypothetical protein